MLENGAEGNQNKGKRKEGKTICKGWRCEGKPRVMERQKKKKGEKAGNRYRERKRG